MANLKFLNGMQKMNDDEHELGKAIFGMVMLSGIPIFIMLYMLFQ